MKEVIDLAADSQFSQFSKKVKQSLEDKLRNHPTVKANDAKLKSFEDMKNQFAMIKKPSTDIETIEVPSEEVPDEVVEPSTIDDVTEPTVSDLATTDAEVDGE